MTTTSLSQKKNNVIPTLARKWDTNLNRYIVVSKVDKWKKGDVLMVEAPFGFCGANKRNVIDRQNKNDVFITKARDQEEKRLQRYQDAKTNLQWSDNQILLYEMCLTICYEKEVQSSSSSSSLSSSIQWPNTVNAGFDYLKYINKLFDVLRSAASSVIIILVSSENGTANSWIK